MKLVARSVILILLLPTGSEPPCGVQVQPRLALAPVRFVRVKAWTDAMRGGRLVLLGEDGVETSSDLLPGPRTTWVEWKNLALVAGDYEVRFMAGSCTAHDQIHVAGGEP